MMPSMPQKPKEEPTVESLTSSDPELKALADKLEEFGNGPHAILKQLNAKIEIRQLTEDADIARAKELADNGNLPTSILETIKKGEENIDPRETGNPSHWGRQ